MVEGRYSSLFKLEHVPAAFIADGLAPLQVRYPEVPLVFADSRKFAEEWSYRFLAAALSDAGGDDPLPSEDVRVFDYPYTRFVEPSNAFWALVPERHGAVGPVMLEEIEPA